MIKRILMILTLLICISSQNNTTSVQICKLKEPIWLTSQYFRAGNQDVISTLTGSSSTPTYTFTFSSVLPGIPNLGYGIRRYRGADYLAQQYYQIRRIDLTAATFKVSIQIFGVTNLYILNVPYIAIDPHFPHHLNSFDNVPFNYSQPDLVNISQTAASSYENYLINYTEQAAGRTYTTFDMPLQSNKILLFITSLFINGKFASGGTKYPIKLKINTQIHNANIYELKANLSTQVKITRLHFSQIMVNEEDIRSSGKYAVVYILWEVPRAGGFRQLPQEFIDNFIMGVTDFETEDGRCGFEFQWQFTNQTSATSSFDNSVFGVFVLQSTQKSNDCGFQLSRSTIFYIKTWLCDTNYTFFDVVNDKCSTCQICDSLKNLFVNETTFRCDLCILNQCVQCSSMFQCSECNQTNNYFLNLSTLLCAECNFTQCIICISLDNCSLCNYTNGFYLNLTTAKCLKCQSSSNMFINLTNYQCENCSLSQCILCQNLTACDTCNTANGYHLNSSTLHCQICSLNQCIVCLNLNQCKQCNQTNDYFLNGTFCELCTLVGCLQCNTLTKCQICNETGGYFLTLTGICVECANEIFTVTLSEKEVYKSQTSNTINLKLTISNQTISNDLQQFAITKLQSNFNFTDWKVSLNDEILNLEIHYSNHVQGLIAEISLFQQIRKDCFRGYQFTVLFSADNNLAFIVYSDEDYQKRQSMKDAFQTAEILSYSILFLSLLPAKIVGLELFGVLQLAFLSLAQQNRPNILLSPLINMKQLNGLNIFLQSESKNIPERIETLSYRSQFLNNCNVMLFVLFAQIAIGAILFTVSSTFSNVSPKISKVSKHLLKQVLITLLLFNTLNLSFSIGLHFTYADSSSNMYVISSISAIAVLLIIFGMMLALSLTGSAQFGEFKNKLKIDSISQAYFVITLAYRLALGAYIACMNEVQESTLIILAFTLGFLLYNFVNLPFKDAYQNYRANICHIAQCGILIITNYYRSMKSNTVSEVKAFLYTPAYIQIALIYTSIAISAIILGYEIYIWIQQFIHTEPQKQQNLSDIMSVQNSDDQNNTDSNQVRNNENLVSHNSTNEYIGTLIN